MTTNTNEGGQERERDGSEQSHAIFFDDGENEQRRGHGATENED